MPVIKSHKTITYILFGTCLILALLCGKQCKTISDRNDFEQLYNASQDELQKTRNEKGEEVAKNNLLYGSVENFKKLIAGKDSTLAKLQKLVNKNTISATILNNTTHNTIGTNTTVTMRDTVWRDSLIELYPEYKSEFADKWQQFHVVATRDTILIDYSVFNEFEISQQWEREKWYKAKVAKVTVTNKNPHTYTQDLRSFTIKPEKQNTGKKVLVGIGIGLVGGYFIFN